MLSKLLRSCLPCFFKGSGEVVSEERVQEFRDSETEDLSFAEMKERSILGLKTITRTAIIKTQGYRLIFFVEVLKVEIVIRSLALHPDLALFSAVWRELILPSTNKYNLIESAKSQVVNILVVERGEGVEDEGWQTVLPRRKASRPQNRTETSAPMKLAPTTDESLDITDLCRVKSLGRMANGKHCMGYKAVAKRRYQGERRRSLQPKRDLNL